MFHHSHPPPATTTTTTTPTPATANNLTVHPHTTTTVPVNNELSHQHQNYVPIPIPLPQQLQQQQQQYNTSNLVLAHQLSQQQLQQHPDRNCNNNNNNTTLNAAHYQQQQQHHIPVQFSMLQPSQFGRGLKETQPQWQPATMLQLNIHDTDLLYYDSQQYSNIREYQQAQIYWEMKEEMRKAQQANEWSKQFINHLFELLMARPPGQPQQYIQQQQQPTEYTIYNNNNATITSSSKNNGEDNIHGSGLEAATMTSSRSNNTNMPITPPSIIPSPHSHNSS